MALVPAVGAGLSAAAGMVALRDLLRGVGQGRRKSRKKKSSSSRARALQAGKELKYANQASLLAYTIPAVGVVKSLLGLDVAGTVPMEVAQGTGVSDRIGRKIWIKSLEIQCRLQQGTATTYQKIMIALILDTQSAKHTNTEFQDIFEFNDENSIVNMDNTGRFRILRRWNFNPKNSMTTNGTYVKFEHYIKFKKPLLIRFDGTTGAATETVDNNLLMAFIGSSGTCTLNGSMRIRYTD